MSIERISTIQTASVITQPVDATERLTLVEKLRNKRKEWASNPHYWMDSNLIGDVFSDVIRTVKQHQAKSDWISVDERLPDKDGKYLVYCVGNRELTKDRKELSIMRFNQKTKGGWFALSPLFKVIYWQQIQPPSEVQDANT